MKKVNKINIVGSIGNLPSSYNASLSYEEQVSYLWNYIKSLNLQNIANKLDQIANQIDSLNNKINQTNTNIGDLDSLTTSVKTSIVNAINEIVSNINTLNTDIGNLTELNTSDKSNLVNAINETFNLALSNYNHIGALSSLNTTYKLDIVGAINEVNSHTDSNTSNIGTLNSLNTTDKSNLVSAVNEVNNKTEVEDFTSKVTFNESAIQNHCQFKKVGKIIIISYQGESKAHSASELILTLPSGYRPSNDIYVPFVSSNNAYGHLQITPQGLVNVNQISNTTNTGRLYFNFSFTLK